MLEHYEPQKFFHWFEKITQIPRPSFHEEKIGDFLEDFAKDHHLAYTRDGMHNILMRLPASRGYENEPPLLLQSHTDMIAEKEAGVAFDFCNDPLRLKVVGNELRAQGTTLGADDAGGMAMMLAVADSPDLPHPALELLFTSQEEVGLIGIQAFDLSQIKARRMLNLDCGRMHNISVSSAGALPLSVTEQFPLTAAQGALLSLVISGGSGGHAGLLIHKNRACAANVLGEMLVELGKTCPLRLVSLNTPRQAILEEMEASFAIPQAHAEEAVQALRETFDRIKKRHQLTDPRLCLTVTAGDCREQNALSPEDSMRAARLMFMLRTGVKKHDGEDPQIVLTSAAISGVKLREGSLRLNYTIRAVEDQDSALQYALAAETIRLLNFTVTAGKGYPGWPKQHQSPLLDMMDRVHERLFGYAPGHRYIHGGIEVGVIMGAIPDMDAAGMLPSMDNAHTPREVLYIDQVPDYWKLLTAILAEKVAAQ